MAKIFRLRNASTPVLRRRRNVILASLRVPANAMRASYARQYLTCGKANCRCRRGHKHGPFHYLVQCLKTGTVRKFLLKSADQKEQAHSAVVAYIRFQERLEELSQLNTELVRRGEVLET